MYTQLKNVFLFICHHYFKIYLYIFFRHPLGDSNPENWPTFSAEDPISYELNPKREGILTYPRSEDCEFWRPYLDADVPVARKDC